MPDLSAGIGFFGLAEVPTPSGPQAMSDWLQVFVYTVKRSESLEGVAGRLADQLNAAVPRDWREQQPSGFYLAGFTDSGAAEFWFIRNVDDNGEPVLGRYEPREDFQRRDAPNLLRGRAQVYRSGDIRAHVTAWTKMDEAFRVLLGTVDFRELHAIAGA